MDANWPTDPDELDNKYYEKLFKLEIDSTAKSIDVEDNLYYWVNESALRLFPGKQATFRIQWSSFPGEATGENYIDNLAVRGTFHAPYAKYPQIDNLSEFGQMVGMSNPYVNPNTGQ